MRPRNQSLPSGVGGHRQVHVGQAEEPLGPDLSSPNLCLSGGYKKTRDWRLSTAPCARNSPEIKSRNVSIPLV